MTKAQKAKLKLDDVVKAAQDAGAKVTFSMDPIEKMPRRYPNDPEAVTLLVAESERVNALGQRWMNAEIPNQIAAQKCLELGWAYALAAAHLRCYYNGELEKKPQAQPQ